MDRTSNKDIVFQVAALTRLGINPFDISALRRISRTLGRWAELECGDGNEYGSWSIERDDETAKPYFVRHNYYHGSRPDTVTRTPITDKERGALKRLSKIMESYPELVAYHQGDPRGAALYIVSRERLNGRDINSCYTDGVAVY